MNSICLNSNEWLNNDRNVLSGFSLGKDKEK